MLLGNIWLWFSCFWISFSLHIVQSPKISAGPFLHSSLFCRTVLLSALLVFSVGVVWISFPALTCSSECFTVCPTSILVLNFSTAVRLLFGRFINYNIKIYTRWFTWKTLNGFITNRYIKLENHWRGIFSFIKFGFS